MQLLLQCALYICTSHIEHSADPASNVVDHWDLPIAVAMQEVLGLSWRSSTKLLIHFGDAPPHGRQYHESSIGVMRMFGYDLYPDGDPNGELAD